MRQPTIVTFRQLSPEEEEIRRLRAIEELQPEDLAWREGFEEGFDYAIEQFQHLYNKKGFCRVNEIANILWSWSERILRPWKVRGIGKFVASFTDWGGRKYEEHPRHDCEAWADIRLRVIRRDGKCLRCGDVLKLEVDHVVEVQDGGLPIDENLQTLCRSCHIGKRHWANP